MKVQLSVRMRPLLQIHESQNYIANVDFKGVTFKISLETLVPCGHLLVDQSLNCTYPCQGMHTLLSRDTYWPIVSSTWGMSINNISHSQIHIASTMYSIFILIFRSRCYIFMISTQPFYLIQL